MTYAYIISNDTVIASVKTDIKNGTVVAYSTQKVKEEIDANRDFNLVSAINGKISRAKRWNQDAAYCELIGVEINPCEFFIS
jgi:uncharacterized protein (UPF0264 family)